VSIGNQGVFQNPLSNGWLHFMHNQAYIFRAAVEKVEGQTVTVFEVIGILNNLKNNLAPKSEDCFLSSAVKTILGKLEEEGSGPEVATFRQYVHTFYQTAREYLCKWTSPLETCKPLAA
jgi:hypothetical protein